MRRVQYASASNLAHGSIRIKDAFLRRFLPLFDGEHDRAALAAFIASEGGKDPDEAQRLLDRAIELFVELRLLMA